MALPVVAVVGPESTRVSVGRVCHFACQAPPTWDFVDAARRDLVDDLSAGELNDGALPAALMRRPAPDRLARNLPARFRDLAGVFGAAAFALKSVEGMWPDEVVDVTLLQEEAIRITRSKARSGGGCSRSSSIASANQSALLMRSGDGLVTIDALTSGVPELTT